MLDTIEITYNQKARQYEFIHPETGEIFAAPAKQKGELFRAVISMLDPELYAAATRIIERHPQLERGVWKAVEIVANDGVELVMANGVLSMIASSDGMGRYPITSDNGYLSCSCEHFQSMAAPMTEQGNRYCKHLLAHHLWMSVRAEF